MLIRCCKAGGFAITISYSMRFSPAEVMGRHSVARIFFILKMLEAFDTTWDASPIVRAHLAPGIIRTKVWDMRLGSMEWLNKCDHGRVRCPEGGMHGGHGKQDFFDAYYLFWWHGSPQMGQGHMRKRTDGLGDR